MRALLIAALLTVSATTTGAGGKLGVVATTADLAAIAGAVGGDAVDVTTLARAGEDPHFVDAKPSFIRLLNQADVLIEGGAALEVGWLPPLLDGARNPRIATGAPGRVVASEGIALREVPSELDRSLGDVHPLGNPHYLLDPVNAKAVATTIATRLCALDQPRCDAYRAGAGRFAAAIDEKLPAWQAALAPAHGTKVVSYHKTYNYFFARFGLEVLDTLEPKPGIPPSPARLAELVPRIQGAHVRALVAEPFRERQMLDFVAEKTGAKVVLLPIMPEGGKDYVALIDRDVRTLAEAVR